MLMPMAPLTAATSDWDSSYYYSEIEWMIQNGIMSTNESDSFRVDDCTNRAEFVKVLYSLKGGMKASEANFSDVPEGAWFESYVEAAHADGVASGYSDGSFKPAQCVTRAEGVKMAMAAFDDQLPVADPAAMIYYNWYTDITEEDWFYDPLFAALNLQVVGDYHADWGDDYVEGSFYPNEAMPREEVAALFYRIQAVIDNEATHYDYQIKPMPLGEIFTKACTIDKSDMVKGVPVEWGMHADAAALLKIDGTNRGQLRQLFNHGETLGNGELWSSLMEAYNNAVMDDFSYENLGEEILMDDWQIGMTWVPSDSDEGDFALAVSTAQYNEFQELIATVIWQEYGAGVECESFGDYTLWTVEWDDLYVLRYGDLFTFSTSEAMRQALLSQVQAGAGHDFIAMDALAYGAVDVEASLSTLQNMWGEAPLDMGIEDFDTLEFTLEAGTDGFHLVTDTSFTNEDSPFLTTYEDATLELADQVPGGEGLMMYFEDQDLSVITDVLMTGMSPEEDGYAVLEEMTGFESETLRHLAESGYAVSVSDSNGAVPNVAFYLHLTHQDEKALASQLTDEMDVWLRSIATETYYTEDAEVVITTLVQNEDLDGDLRQWTIQKDALEMDAEAVLKEDDLELVYGLVEEDVYVIALYDDFLEAWGSTSVEETRRFEIASENIDHHSPAKVQFLDFPTIGVWMETLVARSEGEYIQRDFNEATAWLDRLGVLYGSSYVTPNSVLRQELFWEL